MVLCCFLALWTDWFLWPLFFYTETHWPLGKRSMTAQNAFLSGFFDATELKHVFTQYCCLPRYCFAMFWVCCLALPSWAWFWSPFTNTKLTIRVCDIDGVICVFFYSLVLSLLCYLVWGWAGLIADHLKLLTREAIIGTLSILMTHPHSNVNPECTHGQINPKFCT